MCTDPLPLDQKNSGKYIASPFIAIATMWLGCSCSHNVPIVKVCGIYHAYTVAKLMPVQNYGPGLVPGHLHVLHT